MKEVWFFTDKWGAGYNEGDEAFAAILMEPKLPEACGAGKERVVIGSKHPLYNSVVSAVLTAKASSANVVLAYLERCSVRKGYWDFGYLKLK